MFASRKYNLSKGRDIGGQEGLKPPPL